VNVHIVQMVLAFDGFIGQLRNFRSLTLVLDLTAAISRIIILPLRHSLFELLMILDLLGWTFLNHVYTFEMLINTMQASLLRYRKKPKYRIQT